jgi:hypothetical protein
MTQAFLHTNLRGLNTPIKTTVDSEACWCDILLAKMRSLALAPRSSMASNAAWLVVFLVLTIIFGYGAAGGLVSGWQRYSSKIPALPAAVSAKSAAFRTAPLTLIMSFKSKLLVAIETFRTTMHKAISICANGRTCTVRIEW